MAQNIMRVNSINDRYVTETMIGLNLNLNEEIDFDFFDDIQKPSEEILGKKKTSESRQCSLVNIEIPCEEILSKEEALVSNTELKPCSPVSDEDDDDDDDVQVSPQILHQNLADNKTKLHQGTETTKIEDNLSSDSAGELSSTNSENEENIVNSFDGYLRLENSDDTDIPGSMHVLHKHTQASLSSAPEVHETASSHFQTLQDDTVPERATENFESVEGPIKLSSIMKLSTECGMTGSMPLSASQEPMRLGETFIDPKNAEELDSITDPVQPDHFPSSKECAETNSLPLEEGALSCKTNESNESATSDSNSDSDEGCPFEGSDSEELLLAVHTLTIIPRDRDRLPSNPEEKMSELLDDMQKTNVQCASSCEKANVTARSSSGYSSASCKTHGCTALKKAANSKANVRQSSPVKICTPDMDEFIKSFRSLQPASPVVSFSSCHKLSSKNPSRKKSRKNMSFSNEELQRIERENAILLNKIVLQQRARPPVVHNYERRICSHAINRARQMKRIEYDNEILLRKIQDVKRRSPSTSSSRCTSQASSSQSN